MNRTVEAAIASLAVVAFAIGTPPEQPDRLPVPTFVRLEDGRTVQSMRVKWLVGPWQSAHDHTRRVDIIEDDAGVYLMRSVGDDRAEEYRIVVFKVDCYRLVEMRSTAPDQKSTMYAVLSGYSERLSLDVLPATFPRAWRDKTLIAAVGAGDAEEVPAAKRGEALVWLIGQIDEIGTLMQQDMTYFRPLDDEK